MQLQPGQPRRLVNGPVVRTDFRLLECSEELLSEIVKTGVVIKGSAEQGAVLCTKTKTFALKYVETTNLQLLVAPTQVDEGMQDFDDDAENLPLSAPGLQTQLQKLTSKSARAPAMAVTATNQAHFEVVETAPRLTMLEQLLSERPYGEQDEAMGKGSKDDMDEDGAAPGMYTMEDLLARVQASAAEVLAGLRALGAVQLGQYWRLVEPSYLGSLLELLISSAQQQGHPLDAIPSDEMCSSLAEHGFEAGLVLHCLHTYGQPVEGQEQQGHGGMGAKLWTLDENKVCRHFAAKLLSGGRPLVAGDFMQAWCHAVPEGLQPNLDMLRGEALVQGKGPLATVKHFPASKLPRDPAQRFDILFAERPKWEACELEPYIAELKVPGLSMGALLLKYARASQPTPSDPVTYSARYT